jgi:hypothetical protein
VCVSISKPLAERCDAWADMIDSYGEDLSYAVYRLASRNETHGNYKATDEELLQELIDELKREFEKDLRTKTRLNKDEDYKIAYPLYTKRIKEKAEKFKSVNSGFRKLACMPTFMLGMVMASRVRRHYVHAPWFKASSLVKMVDVHGAVSAYANATSNLRRALLMT